MQTSVLFDIGLLVYAMLPLDTLAWMRTTGNVGPYDQPEVRPAQHSPGVDSRVDQPYHTLAWAAVRIVQPDKRYQEF